MSDLALLIERLGLSDAEALEVFDLDPLSVIGGTLAHRPQLAILVTLTAEALEHVSAQMLRSWMRVGATDGRTPLVVLQAGEYAAFEDLLTQLIERGFVLRSPR